MEECGNVDVNSTESQMRAKNLKIDFQITQAKLGHGAVAQNGRLHLIIPARSLPSFLRFPIAAAAVPFLARAAMWPLPNVARSTNVKSTHLPPSFPPSAQDPAASLHPYFTTNYIQQVLPRFISKIAGISLYKVNFDKTVEFISGTCDCSFSKSSTFLV